MNQAESNPGLKSVAKTVEEYLARLPDDQRASLRTLRELIKVTVPEATEAISYDIPTFKYRGRPLISIGAWKNHCAVYGMSVALESHKDLLHEYDTSKGTIRFAPEKPLPGSLVEDLLRARTREIDAKAASRATKRRDE